MLRVAWFGREKLADLDLTRPAARRPVWKMPDIRPSLRRVAQQKPAVAVRASIDLEHSAPSGMSLRTSHHALFVSDRPAYEDCSCRGSTTDKRAPDEMAATGGSDNKDAEMETVRRLQFSGSSAAPAALLAAAAVCLVAYLANNYIADNRLAAEQDLAIRRLTSTNMELQVALDRLRDEKARRLQRFGSENDLLRARLSELEQHQSQLSAATPATTQKGNRKAGPTAAPAQPINVAPTGEDSGRASAMQIPAVSSLLLEGSTNFRSPGWVPDYFNDENVPLTNARPRGRVSVKKP